MCFYIIKYVYSFQRTRIFFPHFVGVFIYAGTINRPLRLRTVCQNIADGLPKHCERIAKTLRTDCQNVADGLPKHCEHSTKCQRTIREMRNEHTVRRRGRFIVPVSLRNQKRVFP